MRFVSNVTMLYACYILMLQKKRLGNTHFADKNPANPTI